MSDPAMTFLCFQQERAPQEDRLHWQGYVEFAERTTLASAKRYIGETAHMEPARTPQAVCVKYCSKVETAVPDTFEKFGTLAAGKPQNQWDALKEAVKDRDRSFNSIVEDHFGLAVRYFGGIRSCFNAVRGGGAGQDRCSFVFWGKTGVGKSSLVYKLFGEQNIYVKPEGKWWDNYNGERIILLDDFYGGLPAHNILNLCDRYRYQVEVKGGMAYMQHAVVCFTSNAPMKDWYHNIPQDVKLALERRIPDEHVFELRENMDHVRNSEFDTIDISQEPIGEIIRRVKEFMTGGHGQAGNAVGLPGLAALRAAEDVVVPGIQFNNARMEGDESEVEEGN